MSMPFYVSPEQLMKDRADFARKGIARGRSVVVLGYDRGIAFVADNPSRALHKVSEIYDRIAFAAVGKYNEFENLRVAGVRYADLRGYSYDRSDVTARGLANVKARLLSSWRIVANGKITLSTRVWHVAHEYGKGLGRRGSFSASAKLRSITERPAFKRPSAQERW